MSNRGDPPVLWFVRPLSGKCIASFSLFSLLAALPQASGEEDKASSSLSSLQEEIDIGLL